MNRISFSHIFLNLIKSLSCIKLEKLVYVEIGDNGEQNSAELWSACLFFTIVWCSSMSVFIRLTSWLVPKMSKSYADEKILSYNDVVLRRSDLDILSGPYFLNDRIIEFYFSYLSSCYPSQDILLVPPSIAFWIMKCPVIEALKDFLEPLHLTDKTLVIFPINDNDDVSQAEGGSHWSLLAYYRNTNLFVHHDSTSSMNKEPAEQLYKAVVGYIGVSNSACEAKFRECPDSPKQVNGYDCGLYVTATARVICGWHVNNKNTERNSLWFSDLKEQVTPSFVAAMRSEILALIKDIMARQ